MASGQSNDDSLTILVAIPHEWNFDVGRHLETSGFVVFSASTREEAFVIIEKETLNGIVIISDWAATIEGEKGVMEMIKGKIPSVNLITKDTHQQIGYRWVDELYFPPLHEYCTVPVDKEEFTYRLNSVLQAYKSN